MIREVDLVSYLPEFMQSYTEPVAALEGENPEFDIMWNAVDRVLYNRFISTADEYGISRFEKMLGISPNITDSLELRRNRVQNRWINTVPYTMKTLTQKLINLLGGEHNFSLWGDFKTTYELVVVVYTLDSSSVEELKYTLETTVPANMVVNIIYESGLLGDIHYGAIMHDAEIIELEQR